MSNSRAILTIARHASQHRTAASSLFRRSTPLGASTLSSSSSSSSPSSSNSISNRCTSSTPLSSHASRRIDYSSSSSSSSSVRPRSHFLLYGAAAAVAALSFPTSFLDSSSSCQSPHSPSSNGLADETEDLPDDHDHDNVDDHAANEIVRDGMDTGSEAPSPPQIPRDDDPHFMTGLADSDDDDDEDDDDDDPSKDEETSCSICLINRQGPCRKYWVKFERCMKDHSAEKERRRREVEMEEEEEEADVKDSEEGGAKEKEEGEEEDAVVSTESLQEEWDDFMVKSTRPGEDDDEEDDEEEDDGDDDEEEEEQEEEENNIQSDNKQSHESNNEAEEEGDTLAARCDKYMLPWISCIQEHRNVYSLISNEFYQKDYVDPLEDTIPDERRYPFAPLPSEDDNDDDSKSSDAVFARNNDEDATSPVESQQDGISYSIRFRGVEVDLESWREYIEADADDNGDDILLNHDDNIERKDSPSSPLPSEREPQPRLINAYAKFKLIEPDGKRPIEVAYVKDQKGRLLGFDSFSKRDVGGSSDDGSGNGGIHDNASGETSERDHPHGECTFHLVPGETTSVRAYAIYRGVTSADGEGEKTREGDNNIMYHTSEIPLPGVDAESK